MTNNTLVSVFTLTIRRCYLHRIWRYVSSVGAAIFTRARLWNALLITSKLDKPTQIFLAKAFQTVPEILYMFICLHQSNLVHCMCLYGTEIYGGKKLNKFCIISVSKLHAHIYKSLNLYGPLVCLSQP